MKPILATTALGVASAFTIMTACSPRPIDKTPSAADVAATAAPSLPAAPSTDMKKVLDQLGSMGGKAIETLTAAEARKQPTPADAVKAVMTAQGMSTAPDPAVKTKDVTYPAGAGLQKARIYMPAGAKAPLPVILYIHGGGWVIADIDVYGGSPQALAKAANAIVVSIEYRHAPEAKFPAAHDDSNAAYKWMLANAAKWGGDPKKVAIVGESAGGNLAVDVAIMARDKHLQAPTSVIAVYPIADSNMSTASKLTYAAAKPLNTPMMAWFYDKTLAKPTDAMDPRLNLVAADLRGLPPTTIILAQIDPLHDDGVNLAGKLKAAGVNTTLKEYSGVTHEFFGMGSVVASAKAAEDFAASQLKVGFGT